MRRLLLKVVTVATLGATSVAAQACPYGRAPAGDLGFRWLHCASGGPCYMQESDTERWYDLVNVPRVRMVSATGPAANVLRDGDAILSIDGVPTTSIAGGRRLARVVPGSRVELLIERGGERRTVSISAGHRCGLIGLAVNSITDSAGFADHIRDPARRSNPLVAPAIVAPPTPTRRTTPSLDLEFVGEVPLIHVDSVTGIVTLEFRGSRVVIQPRRPDPNR